ncbi:MAG: type II toxin-antitoxin system RelE/ParE family toxin [Candidatus Nanopelagicales bacterium]|nr:type II toxin-antitoxin system RelE/ParE family toxin [Candidatus Nanopelagicales bacterium]MDZ4249843.1 type II toxin-antitoxin system RelE/ParE family toxin [Candidatus Nanopelagicales bacterium]
MAGADPSPPVNYEVLWSATAVRALDAVPEKIATAAVEFIYAALADNPARVGKPLGFELEGLHSARRGDYRVVYMIDEQERTVTITAIQHRADVYRRR